MRGKRMWQTLRLYMILSPVKRTRYYKEKEIFHSMGDNCLIMDRIVPLYARLISMGNNVHIASNVQFITHDITHSMLNRSDKALSFNGGKKYPEKVGCIEIGDNVFIGSGTHISYNVKIGSNVIIGACSFINKDVPDNSVVAGVPARVIKTLDEYLKTRIKDEAIERTREEAIERTRKETVNSYMEEIVWNNFRKERG